jgi:urease accessory protein
LKRVSWLLLLLPIAASAHPMPGVGDFYAGMLHPVTALEQLLPILALSVLAAQQGKRAARELLIALPLAIVAGAVASPAFSTSKLLITIPLAATVALGLLTAVAKPISRFAIVPIAVVTGLSIGAANALDSGAQVSLLRFTGGMALAGVLLCAYVTVAMQELFAVRAPVAIRVAGSWLAAIGIMTLALK